MMQVLIDIAIYGENRRNVVIPGLTRNPVNHLWIPAFAGMTG